MSVVLKNILVLVEMDKRKDVAHKCVRLNDDVLEKVNIMSKLTGRTPEEVVNDTLWDNLRKIQDVPEELDVDRIWNLLEHDNPEGDNILDELSSVNELLKE